MKSGEKGTIELEINKAPPWGRSSTSAGLGSPRARVHLTKKRAHVHARACNVHVVPTNVLRIFSYPKFCIGGDCP